MGCRSSLFLFCIFCFLLFCLVFVFVFLCVVLFLFVFLFFCFLFLFVCFLHPLPFTDIHIWNSDKYAFLQARTFSCHETPSGSGATATW